jgi:dephospho-CoA kinase
MPSRTPFSSAPGARPFALPVVGLTGGIASGKSAVAALLAGRGVPVVDADALARDVVRPGAPALAAVVAALGPEVLDPRGGLDRGRVAALVFADPDLRATLEGILHPAIHAAATAHVAAAAAAGHRWAVYEAALLVETGFHAALDALIVVAAPPEIQLARAMTRDGADREAVKRRLAAQLPLDRKIAVADHVIDNAGSREELERQVAAAYAALTERFG